MEYWNAVMSYLTNEKLKELLINNNPDRYAIFTEQRQSRNAGAPDNKLKRKRATQHLGGTQEEWEDMRTFHGSDVTGMWAAVKREQAAKKAMGKKVKALETLVKTMKKDMWTQIEECR